MESGVSGEDGRLEQGARGEESATGRGRVERLVEKKGKSMEEKRGGAAGEEKRMLQSTIVPKHPMRNQTLQSQMSLEVREQVND